MVDVTFWQQLEEEARLDRSLLCKLRGWRSAHQKVPNN